MAFVFPRLDPQVRFEPSEVDGEDIYFYSSPLSEGLFRFNELQHEMLQRLDGKTPLEHLASELSERYETEIPAAMAQQFVSQAGSLLLLDDVLERRQLSRLGRLRLSRAVLRELERARLCTDSAALLGDGEPSLSVAKMIDRLRARDPRGAWGWLTVLREWAPDHPATVRYEAAFRRALNRFFAVGGKLANEGKFDTTVTLGVFDGGPVARWLAPKIGWLFSGWFLVAAAVLYLATLFLALELETPRIMLDPVDAVLLYGAFALAFVWHELCHATALAAHGRSPGAIGFGLLHGFIPMAYTDTTEVVLLRRTPRILVFTAGNVGDIVVLFGCSVALHLLRPDHVLFRPLFVFIWAQLVMILRNQDPSLRQDGHNVLTELMREQDLFRAAFGFCGAVLRKWFLGGPEPKAVPRKRQLGYLVFTAWAILSVTFVYYVVMVRGLLGWLLDLYRGAGLVIWIALVMYIGSGQLRAAAAALRRSFMPALRALLTHRRALAATVLLFAAGAALLAVPAPMHLEADLVVNPMDRQAVRAEESGQISEVRVQEGQQVREGEVVAVLQSPELQLQLHQARLRLRIAEQRLLRLAAGPRREEVARVAARISGAEAAEAFGANARSFASALQQAGVASASQLLDAERDLARLRAELKDGQGELELLVAGARPEELQEARAQLDAARAEVSRLEQRREKLVIKAPAAGKVAMLRPAELLGLSVARGSALFELVDPGSLRAEILVPASVPLDELSAGAKVRLQLASHPGLTVETTVVELKAKVSAGAGEQAVEVRTSSLGLSELQSGATGRARIYGRPRSLLFRWLLADLSRVFRYDFWALF